MNSIIDGHIIKHIPSLIYFNLSTIYFSCHSPKNFDFGTSVNNFIIFIIYLFVILTEDFIFLNLHIEDMNFVHTFHFKREYELCKVGFFSSVWLLPQVFCTRNNNYNSEKIGELAVQKENVVKIIMIKISECKLVI